MTVRERDFLIGELSQVRGLMPLLMKRRNGGDWTPEERVALKAQLRRLGVLTPYLALSVLPGGFAVLPLLAWWLDRRRSRRGAPADAPSTPGADRHPVDVQRL